MSRWSSVVGLAGFLGLAAVASSGCGGDDPPRCVTVDAACTPRYQPTFANVYTNTLKDSCGSQSVACHSAAGRKGGLSMETAEIAFEQLTAAGTGRVVAGDPACSETVVRLHGSDEEYLMPPGAPLPAADRCAIEQWIAAGASFSP
jgi:Planctomycete cytochrome C